MNKINEQTETSPNSDAIKFKPQETLLLHTHSKLSTSSIEEEVDREHFHWGATAEVMEIIRRRNKSPETRRLGERSLKIARHNEKTLRPERSTNDLGPISTERKK